MTFGSLLRHEPRALMFGLLHTIAATVGQTFLISLFLPGIKQSFALGDGEVSLLFTATTLASAAALWKIGAWIDRADIVRYSLGCGVFLAFACTAIAAARDIETLVIAMFCLRLAGNGLLTHVALTGTARYFTRRRGQALSLVLLGSSIGEGVLPAPVVAAVAAWGWRPTLGICGAMGFVLVLAAAVSVRRQAAFRNALEASAAEGTATRGRRLAVHTGRPNFFLIAAPLFVAMPMLITAAIFHQSLLAAYKGVSLQWFAISFAAFASMRVIAAVLTGPVVDRIGSAWLFAVHLLPLAVGTAALVAIDSTWVVPLYWLCGGMTSGMGQVLQTTVVAERVPAARLGSARSVLGAVSIVASAAGPSLYGLSLSGGASLLTMLYASVAALLIATALGLFAAASER